MKTHQAGDKHDIPDHHRMKRIGHWLPADHRVHRTWLDHHIKDIDSKRPKDGSATPLHPAVERFKRFIDTTPRVSMYFTAMWDEVPTKAPYCNDPTGQKQIRDCEHMLEILSKIFGTAPAWTDAAAGVGMVGVPMHAIFDYAMATPSGHAAFLDPDVNRELKVMMNAWGKFLTTPASAEVLTDGKEGWFGEVGTRDVMSVANAPYKTSHRFEDMFVCDPKAKHHGYKSWDDFFTRKVHDKARPIDSPDDDSVVVSACESRVYNIACTAAPRAKFWIKGQPYSILDMLAHDPLSKHFAAGATVYQAFLSALSYHRWHAPVSGTIKRAFVAEGTYFSEPLFEGLGYGDAEDKAIDPKGLGTAQGYLTALATRAVIFIEADNKDIGLMAFIGVGMDEVSTCEITVKEGQHVKKGDETGMFHFGGSSNVLLFRKGVKIEGFPQVGREENVPVRGRLAVVKGQHV